MYSLRDILKAQVDLVHRPNDLRSNTRSQVRVITTQALFDALSSPTIRRDDWIDELGLVVCEDMELLDDHYELAISLLLHSIQTRPVRIVSLCSSINDPMDVARWLRVPEEGCYSFKPTERDQALSITSHTFTIPHSAALFKVMAKPLHDTLRSTPQGQTAIVFVPSRGQCLNVVEDLLRLCAVEMSMRGFLGGDVTPEELEPYLGRIRDQRMADGILRGVGVWHDGMDKETERLILQLYADGVIKVLVVPREACWTLPVRAGLVVVMGTQYVKIVGGEQDRSGGERLIVEYTLHELVRMQGRAVRHAQTGRFHIMCQAEHRDAYMRFLNDGLPLESSLLSSFYDGATSQGTLLKRWFAEERKQERIVGKQDAVDALGFTFMSRRVESNPVYYDAVVEGGRDVMLSRLVDRLFEETNPTTAPAVTSQSS